MNSRRFSRNASSRTGCDLAGGWVDHPFFSRHNPSMKSIWLFMAGMAMPVACLGAEPGASTITDGGSVIPVVIRVDAGGSQNDEAMDILLPHTFQNVGDRVGQHLRLLSGVGSQCGKHRPVATNGIDHSGEIEDISLNDTEVGVLRQPVRIPDIGRYRMSLSQRLGNDKPASTPIGAEDNDLHFEPGYSFPPCCNHHNIHGTTLTGGRHLKRGEASCQCRKK